VSYEAIIAALLSLAAYANAVQTSAAKTQEQSETQKD